MLAFLTAERFYNKLTVEISHGRKNNKKRYNYLSTVVGPNGHLTHLI